jgi:hypothetical protein
MQQDNRVDFDLDAVVNKGLAAAFLKGLAAGMKVMSEGGVPPAVIERVFFDPDRRRSTDWKR